MQQGLQPSPPDGVVLGGSSNNSSRGAIASAPRNHPRTQNRRQERRHKQKKKKKRNRNKLSRRYLLILGLCSMFYVVVLYHSLQLAGQNFDQMMQLDAPQSLVDKRPNRNNNRFKSETILDKVTKFFGKPKRKRVTNRSPHRPRIKPKFAAPKELLLPKPIINVGFPKAGTSTIFSFFHCNGLKAQHWYCCERQYDPGVTASFKLMSVCMLKNMVAGRPLFDNCGDFDVYSEINGPRDFKEINGSMMMDDGTILPRSEFTGRKGRIFFPQHHQLDKIHRDYPNATLILNNRDTEAWVNSVLNWDNNLQFNILNEFYLQNSTKFLFANATNETNIRIEESERLLRNNNATLPNSRGSNRKTRTKRKNSEYALFSKSEARRKFLETVYHYHQQYIRDWISRHPTHALVEVNIADKDAGKTLATAFGLQEECWGHFNKKKPKVTKPALGQTIPVAKPMKSLRKQLLDSEPELISAGKLKSSNEMPPQLSGIRKIPLAKPERVSKEKFQESEPVKTPELEEKEPTEKSKSISAQQSEETEPTEQSEEKEPESKSMPVEQSEEKEPTEKSKSIPAPQTGENKATEDLESH